MKKLREYKTLGCNFTVYDEGIEIQSFGSNRFIKKEQIADVTIKNFLSTVDIRLNNSKEVINLHFSSKNVRNKEHQRLGEYLQGKMTEEQFTQEQKTSELSQNTTTKLSQAKQVILLVVFIFLIGVFIASIDTSPNQTTFAPELVNDQSNIISENLNRIKVNDDELRASAIKLVEQTTNKDFWNRMAISRTFIDVYNNPKGNGYIVWLSNYKSEGGYLYLVQNDTVFGITPDSQIMSPAVTLTPDVTLTDLSDIQHWRSKDDVMKYSACMKHADILRENGLVEKIILEQKEKCQDFR